MPLICKYRKGLRVFNAFEGWAKNKIEIACEVGLKIEYYKRLDKIPRHILNFVYGLRQDTSFWKYFNEVLGAE